MFSAQTGQAASAITYLPAPLRSRLTRTTRAQSRAAPPTRSLSGASGVQTLTWNWGAGGATNANAAIILALLPSGPTINTQPASQSVYLGQTATFTVSATSSGGSLSYQWQQFISGSWTNVGTNSSSYTTAATGYADNGDEFQVLVTDSNGTTTSTAAFLTVIGIATLAWIQ